MAKKPTTKIIEPKKGIKITKGSGWKLTATEGTPREFKAKCLGTVNSGDVRIAFFRVPK